MVHEHLEAGRQGMEVSKRVREKNTEEMIVRNSSSSILQAMEHRLSSTTEGSSEVTYGDWMMRSTLSKVAQYFPTFIISGRRRDKVYDFVKLANVYYVGSHGMDIMAPTKTPNNGNIAFHENSVDQKENEAILFQPAREFLPIIGQIFAELKDKTKNINGVLIENNKFCVSVHFRRVNKDDWSVLEEQVMTTAKKYTDLHLTRGRKVIEIRPSIKWDKGRALEYVLDNLGFGSSGEAIPLYIGDDKTDEDAFRVLQKRGRGLSIIVSSVPKETMASYSLRDPSEVMSFLLRLSRWKINSSNGRLAGFVIE